MQVGRCRADISCVCVPTCGGIDTDSIRQHIVRGVLAICRDLGVRVIAEGIETREERDFFAAHGVTLMQGYFFAKPAFKSIPVLSGESFQT